MEGENIIHLIPSGYDKSLCGLDSKNIKGTSLGMCCTCEKCYEIGQRLLDKQIERESKKENSVCEKCGAKLSRRNICGYHGKFMCNNCNKCNECKSFRPKKTEDDIYKKEVQRDSNKLKDKEIIYG